MAAFSPKQLSEIYADMRSQILSQAPIASAELGEVIDNIIFATAQNRYEADVQMFNALQLLKLETTVGDDLDQVASEYPNLKPRFQATNATGVQRVTDPSITKIATTISAGGALDGQTFLNANSTSAFPTSGTLLIGVRGSTTFESVTYTGKSPTQFTPTSPLAFDHGAGEPIVLATVGDRVFNGPYSLATEATAQVPSKIYQSTSPLIIYDGEEYGEMNIQATATGKTGNTPSNTIKKFLGPGPFVGATTFNPVGLVNGTPRESDDDLRQRIRRHRQALSTANIDAVTAALFEASFEGSFITLVQLQEDPDPTLPSLLYVDDGSAFTPTQASISTPIILADSAIGGEQFFHLPRAATPIVIASDTENVTRVFSNVTVQKNFVTINQGDGANEYRIQPDKGDIKLNTPLVTGDHLEVTALTHYSGLFQEANKTLYGDRDDRENYPGVIGMGEWVQLRTPAVQFITVSGTIVLDGSRTKTEIVDEITQNIIEYINGRTIGESVIQSKILSLFFVPGVLSASVTTPAADVSINVGVLPRTTAGNITIT